MIVNEVGCEVDGVLVMLLGQTTDALLCVLSIGDAER
jgi:hypothetical protein